LKEILSQHRIRH